MAPHLQRCQGLAVADYSFTLGRLEAGAPSTFAHLGFQIDSCQNVFEALNQTIFNGVALNINIGGLLNYFNTFDLKRFTKCIKDI
jgi:hypothetical protein